MARIKQILLVLSFLAIYVLASPWYKQPFDKVAGVVGRDAAPAINGAGIEQRDDDKSSKTVTQTRTSTTTVSSVSTKTVFSTETDVTTKTKTKSRFTHCSTSSRNC